MPIVWSRPRKRRARKDCSMDRMPNSKVNLDRAISRYTNRDTLKATELGVAMANALIARLSSLGTASVED